MSYSRASRSDLEDRDYPTRTRPRVAVKDYEDDLDVRIRERERERERDRVPAFMREDHRRPEAGALVLSRREVETVDRRAPRSPSPPPQRYVERPRSLSPSRARSLSRARPRYVIPDRSPSPQRDVRVDVDSRIVERRRPRSPTPEHERERIRIMLERERQPSPEPSPSPPPQPAPAPVIKGPTIEREVITHYRDIDHGMVRARSPTPPPPPPSRTPRPTREQCETDIDIRHGRGETDIDITHTHSRSRSRPRPRPQSVVYDDEHLVVRDRDANRRRAHSEVRRNDWDDEAEYITSKIDSRGRMGEAYHGATRDWTIVDVPPGTERVRMDGVGGGGTEVNWQRYNGVRRSKFLPEGDGGASLSSPSASEPALPISDRDRERLSVQIYDDRDRSRDRGRDREREVEEIHDRRISIRESSRPAPPKRKEKEMWTEITKDLVCREAIDQHGYSYEETDYFFYVMEYLRYEDVLDLVNTSDKIEKAAKRRRARERELEWEREWRDNRHPDRKGHHHHFSYDHEHSGSSSRRSLVWDKVDDERVVEREVIYDRPPRTYLR